MAVNSLNRKKFDQVEKKKKQEFKEQLKKFKDQGNSSFKSEEVKKDNVVELYKKMSPQEKAAFEKELDNKKIRDNYSLYLKKVYPDYIFTKFHALLCNICQSVVEKIEQGQKVKICISCPPQHGKLIENNTPVLTTKGWKNHGNLVVGDYVFNHLGEQVKVTHVFPKYFANKKVTLMNGEEILCHENHEWLVYDRKAHKELVLETKYIEQNVNENNLVGRGHRYRFQLPNRKPIKGEKQNLIVNPYVLGVWLGDGNNNKPMICACKEDRITIDECAKFYNVSKTYVHKATGVLYNHYLGLRKDLQQYGMCKYKIRTEKHIPQVYLNASLEQRLELLAGLLDTDGCLETKWNRYVFTTADKELKETFEQLIATFGWRTTTYECKPTISSSGIVGRKKYWQIGFNPTFEIPCRIARKKIKAFSKQRKISICKVENVEHKEGNCIEVEGGVYLVGKTMIPTHNSRMATETLPSWFIGRNPDLRCIVTGYNADIAERFGNNNRQLIKQFGQEIFGVEISDSQDNKTLWNINKHQGGMLATGILGGLTSNGGALIIVDDPFKNGEEASNPDLRQKVYDTFADSVATRARGKGNAIIVIHTRWHDDDLIGRLEKTGEWIVINIPCVWEKGIDKLLGRRIGETLCPELGFDSDWAISMQKLLGNRKWNALYQGKPYVDGGNIVKREDIKWYDENSKPTNFEELVLSCDLTFGGTKTTNDPYCMTLWGRNGGNHYLLNIFDKRASFTETIKTLQIICNENPQLRKKIIERKANGQATIDMLGKEIGGFVPFDPKNTSKEDRLRSVSPYFESGNVYFPSEEVMPKIEDYVTQLLRFPNAEHDDFVDTISQYLLNYEYRYGGKIDTDSRFSMFARAIRGF